MKTILVTGGAGFVGHHFVEHVLKNTDWQIIILDCLSYAGNMQRIYEVVDFYDKSHLTDRVKFIWHDLRAPISETMHAYIGDLDYCVHFASESHVDRSLKDSIPFVMSNVVGTANLLEYFKVYQKKCKILVFSTDEVFGSAEKGIAFSERDSFSPSNPYAAAKCGEEMIAFSFAHAFGLPISIVRSTNIIGERQHTEKFVPKVIESILNNKKVILHGGGTKDISSRCWIHARNVADGLLFLLDKASPKEFYNIAGEERTILEVTNWICQVIKGRELNKDDYEFLDYYTARPGHDKRYALSGDKMKNMGWIPPVDLEKSIKKTVEWTLSHKKWLEF